MRPNPLPCSGALNVVQELVEHGADILVKDKDNNTPFDEANRRDEPEIAEYLLERYRERIVESRGRLSLHAILQGATFTDTHLVLPIGRLAMDSA